MRDTGRVEIFGALVVLLFIIAIPVLIILVIVGIVQFNKLRRLDVQCDGAMGDIDTLLTKRADLVPNLVETVKGSRDFEASTMQAVTQARARTETARSLNEKSAADGALTGALTRFFAVAEAYPQLTATAGFQQLQGQLADVEGQLQFARQYYNDSVVKLNTAVTTIPSMWFTGVAKVGKREFYEEPDDGRRSAPTVQF